MENNRNVILIADDVEINREMLALMFEEQYEVALAENGQEAIDYLNQNVNRVACLLLDLIMPVKTGFDVMEYMKQEGMMKSVPIILITGYNAKEVEESGYDYGVADIIFKPFDANIVMRRVKNVVDLYLHMNHMEELVKRQTADLQAQAESMRRNNEILIDALGHVVDFRIPGAMNHSSRIKKFTSLLLKYVPQVRPDIEMSQERMERIVKASALYDIGKIAMPDSVLNKQGKLTKQEQAIVEENPAAGCDILKLFSEISDKEFYQDCYDICRYHHERWDGSGYPEHLSEDRIPLTAQIVGLVDVYESLISGKGYYAEFTHETAFREILSGEHGRFSPLALECFKLAGEELRSIVEFSEMTLL